MAISRILAIFTLSVLTALNANSTHESDFQIHFKHFFLDAWTEFENPCPNDTKLLTLVPSRRNGSDFREGVRTWMKDGVAGQTHRFLISDPWVGEGDDIQQKLVEEQKEHGDLVFLHGFVDLYEHLQLKMYGGFMWQQMHCESAEWLLKADDDAAVHLKRLDHWVAKKFSQEAVAHPLIIFGNAVDDEAPVRDKENKWSVTYEMFPGNLYPPWVRGGTYLTTTKTLKAIMSHTNETVALHLEDVLYTGILAELANATVSDQRQHFFRKPGECVDGVPTLISVWELKNGEEIKKKYEELKELGTGRSCDH